MNDLVEVCNGARFAVYITRQAKKAFDSADARERARCENWIRKFADDGPNNLDAEKFKHEGKFPTGGPSSKNIPIYAFKAWQLRLYGSYGKGGKCFIVTAVDASKKQNQADRSLMASAAKKISDYL